MASDLKTPFEGVFLCSLAPSGTRWARHVASLCSEGGVAAAAERVRGVRGGEIGRGPCPVCYRTARPGGWSGGVRDDPAARARSSSRSYSARWGAPWRVSFPRLAHFLMVAGETPAASAASSVGTVRSPERLPEEPVVLTSGLLRR